MSGDLFGQTDGASLLCGRLDMARQQELLAEIRAIIHAAPLFQPVMPRTGKPFSVKMSNCGPLGWVSDIDGYRYQPTHPRTGEPWPAMPGMLLELWREHTAYPLPPQACLINWYEPQARMGLHQDRDEEDTDAPVLSVSLGDRCRFRLGTRERKGPTHSFLLESGEVMMLAGANRMAFHGVERIYPATSTLLGRSGRINLTLRRVTRA
ncbi:alpha-ketoglutarate-dependent dioxygenase AlkB family protein [Candidatus Raskinella chloraquaticus]